jgi:alpha-amylase
MLNLVFYFQVHQPYRLKHFKVLDIGSSRNYFDDELNRKIIRKVGDKCYLPANRLLLELIDRYEGRFKVAFSLTGVVIEQFRHYYPEILESFKALARTGCVEFIGETYYHSLAFLYNEEEFIEQIRLHKKLMQDEFGFNPVVFRNTELIYQDKISDIVASEGYKVILAEGVERVLGWRSPLYPYKSYNQGVLLLLKYYSLADDIAFRFSNKGWPEYPLTTEKFVNWISKLSLIERQDRDLFLNLFMDYETFGEHQWEDTGIFSFLKHLPEQTFKYSHLGFAWPSDAIDSTWYEPEPLRFPEAVSWADTERDLSAWLGNDLQHNAIETYYELFHQIKVRKRYDLLDTVRRLSTSDHFYYMCTKYFQDGDVHKYFSPYDSPEQGYLYFINALADLDEKITIPK